MINPISDLHVYVFLPDNFNLIFSSACRDVCEIGSPGNHEAEGSTSGLMCSRLTYLDIDIASLVSFPCCLMKIQLYQNCL